MTLPEVYQKSPELIKIGSKIKCLCDYCSIDSGHWTVFAMDGDFIRVKNQFGATACFNQNSNETEFILEVEGLEI